MKIGLYTADVQATVGGGYVLRDDVARFALSVEGRHRFELITTPSAPLPPPLPRKKWLQARIDWLVMAPDPPPPPERSATQRFLDEVKQRRFDMLWFNNFDPIYVGVPFVMNIFDLQHRVSAFFPEVSDNGQYETREAVYAEAARRAAFVTVGSQEAKEQVRYFYGVPQARIRVLPFPTPQKAIDIATGNVVIPATEDVRSKYGIKNDFLFYPAQFWPHKNHVNLLYALKILKERQRQNISLVFTGSDHGNRSHVEKLARELNLTDQVHFCGFVPYEDILAFYQQARALSYVSFQGPENLPPLEAMTLGCPVILSDLPGVDPLYGGAPFLVEPQNPQSIAHKIEFVLDNPEQARKHIQIGKEVAIRNDCRKYLETFQSMLDEFEFYRRCWP